MFLISGLHVNAYAASLSVNTGGDGASWDKFTPNNVTINAGESITWINPSSVAEPHTVTIIKNEKLFPPLAAPFSVPNNTELTPIGPLSNVEPISMPDPENPNNKLVILENARASSPVVIDASGQNVSYLPPNANYTFSGNESYLNSGWIWPAGQSPPDVPPIYSFTVKFETAGIYDYLCVIHPWMSGTINVK